MNKVNNSRSKETKERLKETLLSLLEEGKPIDTISVKEICLRCNINRSTFYNHYEIPEDILKEIEDYVLRDTKKYLSSMNNDELMNTILLLHYIKQNQKKFYTLLSNNTSSDFSNKLISQTFPIFNRIEHLSNSIHLFPYIKSYVIEGAKNIIFLWLENNCKESEEQIANLIINLSKVTIDMAFKKNTF